MAGSLGLFHLKVWGWGGGTEGFLKGEGPNFELIYPIILYMISGGGGGC